MFVLKPAGYIFMLNVYIVCLYTVKKKSKKIPGTVNVNLEVYIHIIPCYGFVYVDDRQPRSIQNLFLTIININIIKCSYLYYVHALI